MREAEFKQWLEDNSVNGVPNDTTIRGYITDLKRIQREVLPTTSRLNLDEEFVRDGLHEVYNSLQPTEAGRVRHPNQDILNFGEGNAGTANGYRTPIKQYNEFCLRHPRI